MYILMYGSETIWDEEKRSRIRTARMDNLRGLLYIRRIDKVPNARITVVRSDERGGQKK